VDCVPEVVGISACFAQHRDCDTSALVEKADQDVLGADVVVAHAQRALEGELEHGRGPRREWHLARREPLAVADDPRHLRSSPREVDAMRLEHSSRDPFFFAEQPEEQVLGADVVVPKRARLVLREHDDLTSALGEALEQGPA
jgi:hypothetical protein